MAARRELLQEPFITSQRRFHWELQPAGTVATGDVSKGEYFYVTSPVILKIGDYRLPAKLMISSGKGPAKAFDVGLYVDFSQVQEKDRLGLRQMFSILGDSEDTALERDRVWRVTNGGSDNVLGLVRSIPTGTIQERTIPLAGRDPRVKFDEFVQALETIYSGEVWIEPAGITQRYLL